MDRGRLRYDQRVSEFWPEFARNGKQDITVQWILEHKAGLATFNSRITLDAARDHKRIAQIIENAKPRWTPGTKSGYVDSCAPRCQLMPKLGYRLCDTVAAIMPSRSAGCLIKLCDVSTNTNAAFRSTFEMKLPHRTALNSSSACLPTSHIPCPAYLHHRVGKCCERYAVTRVFCYPSACYGLGAHIRWPTK